MSDAYADRTSVTLPKGHYTIRLQVKHEDVALLETYEATPMVLERKLESTVKVPCYASQADALMDVSMGTTPLFLGTSCGVIFGEPAASSLPGSSQVGDVFQGKVTYLKKPSDMAGSGTRPGGYPITFFCTSTKVADKPAAKSEINNKATVVKTEIDKAGEVESKSCEGAISRSVFEMDDTLREAIRDAKLKYLSDLGRGGSSKELLRRPLSQHPFHLAFTSMVAEYPAHVPLRLSALEYFMTCASSSETVGDSNAELADRHQEYLQATVALSDEVFTMIDKGAIMAELGVLVDESDPAATKKRKDIKDIRGQVRNLFWYTSAFNALNMIII